jgi:hypothetical protein
MRFLSLGIWEAPIPHCYPYLAQVSPLGAIDTPGLSHVAPFLVSRRPAGESEWGECHWEDLLPSHSSDPE